MAQNSEVLYLNTGQYSMSVTQVILFEHLVQIVSSLEMKLFPRGSHFVDP
jgi:hypothetical protein